jgi:16S rRNA U1498 N3-methylase RsmE
MAEHQKEAPQTLLGTRRAASGAIVGSSRGGCGRSTTPRLLDEAAKRLLELGERWRTPDRTTLHDKGRRGRDAYLTGHLVVAFESVRGRLALETGPEGGLIESE